MNIDPRFSATVRIVKPASQQPERPYSIGVLAELMEELQQRSGEFPDDQWDFALMLKGTKDRGYPVLHDTVRIRHPQTMEGGRETTIHVPPLEIGWPPVHPNDQTLAGKPEYQGIFSQHKLKEQLVNRVLGWAAEIKARIGRPDERSGDFQL